MFDSNSFDKMNKDIHIIKKTKNEIEYYVTGIQVNELARIPDKKEKTRINNFMNLCEINAKLVATPFTFDYIDFRQLSFNISNAYDELLNQNKSNKNDALIGATAIIEQCLLVTDDKRLQDKMKKLGYEAISYDEFIEQYVN